MLPVSAGHAAAAKFIPSLLGLHVYLYVHVCVCVRARLRVCKHACARIFQCMLV